MHDLGYDQMDDYAHGRYRSPNRKTQSRSANDASALWSGHEDETWSEKDAIHQASEGVEPDVEDWQCCLASMSR